MNVLVACEESQTVCMAFRRRGHNAFSCDLQSPSGGHLEYHILGDATTLLKAKDIKFKTMDSKEHFVDKWDLLIAHPPCTYLSNAGAARLYKKIDGESFVRVNRLNKGLDAKEFFMQFINAPIARKAIENPVPSGVYRLPKYTQIIQPYEFGHPYSKKTCLWLVNLPALTPTKIVKPVCGWVSGGSKRADGTPRKNKGIPFRDSTRRSKTFAGIAKAMAEQWGDRKRKLRQQLNN